MKATLEMAPITARSTNTDPTQYRITLIAEECRKFYEQLQKLIERTS